MDITNNPFGIHERALQARGQRMELLAANIANADTPKFRARDVDFKQMLGNVQREQLQSTHTSHFQFADAASSADAVKYRIPFNASVDGNTVEMNIEQAAYGKAAADYQATLSFIQDTGSSIKRALRGE
jgi:flagellar basal-body rod protein FlgB